MTITSGGNVGIGTTAPAEKLDVAGKIKASGAKPVVIDPAEGAIAASSLNQIVFLRPSGGDDGYAINQAIRGLPDCGGVIMLVPGPPPDQQFNIATTITTADSVNHKTKHGVKIRGYGGGGLDLIPPLTKLLWTGVGAGPVVELAPYGSGPGSEHVQDLELSHLVIDGNWNQATGAGATVGLKLNRVQQSRFVDLRVENIAPGTDPVNDGIAVLLCTDVGGKNVEFNHFEDLIAKAPKALVLDGTEASGGANSNMNVFANLQLHYRGTDDAYDAGIWLKHAGDNSFFRVSIFNDNHSNPVAHGVVVQEPRAAMGNYFYHLTPAFGVYVKNSTQPLPFEGRMMIYSHSIGQHEPFPQMDDPSVPPEKLVFWADDYGEMHGMPNLKVGTSYVAKGTVSVSSTSAEVDGDADTRFSLDVKVGDRVTVVIGGQSVTRTVTGPATPPPPNDLLPDDHFYVDSPFTASVGGLTMRVTKGRLSAGGDVSVGGSFKMGATEVISDQRVLHNVTADAGIIGSGVFAAAQIPGLSALKITSDQLDPARIPNLSALKITSDQLDQARIPGLSASKITSDTLDSARIPSLDASKIGSGTIADARLPTNLMRGLGTGVAKVACGVATLNGSGYVWVPSGLDSITSVVVSLFVDGACPAEAVCAHWTTGQYFVINSSDRSSVSQVAWVVIGT